MRSCGIGVLRRRRLLDEFVYREMNFLDEMVVRDRYKIRLPNLCAI